MWNFMRLVKNEMEFPRMTKKKQCGTSRVFVFGLGISKGSNTVLWNIQRLSFVLSGISRGKVKKMKNSGGGLKKVGISPSPLFGFFLE